MIPIILGQVSVTGDILSVVIEELPEKGELYQVKKTFVQLNLQIYLFPLHL